MPEDLRYTGRGVTDGRRARAVAHADRAVRLLLGADLRRSGAIAGRVGLA